MDFCVKIKYRAHFMGRCSKNSRKSEKKIFDPLLVKKNNYERKAINVNV